MNYSSIFKKINPFSQIHNSTHSSINLSTNFKNANIPKKLQISSHSCKKYFKAITHNYNINHYNF
jgi:hypothetical protein